jgi:cytochrome c
MRIRGLILAATILSGASAAWAADASAGHDMALAKCSRCHSVEAKGSSPLPAAPPFRRLHERYSVADLEEALTEGIVVGHSPMPDFAFSSTETTDLIAYLKTLE